jgi:hypothetical protein
MARRRRASSSVSFVGTAIVASLLMGAIGFFTWKISDPHRTVARLDIPTYLENPTRFSRNSYLIEATINTQLAQSPKGTIYACTAGDHSIAIIVPHEARPAYNLEKDQSLLINLQIADNGAAIVTGITKK